jgi:hypothetical protein
MRYYILLCSIIALCLSSCKEVGDEPYSFFIAGHTYGKAGVNKVGLDPPFKAQFDSIKQQKNIELGVLTGDIVSPHPSLQDWIEVDADVASLGMPVYFAVGNHDMENRSVYEERYNKTYYSFVHKSDLFIVIDPNIDAWNIGGAQLDFLKETLKENKEKIHNVYVFFHQLLWIQKGTKYEHIHPNSLSGRAAEINFWTEVEPLFHQLSKPVFMFAGDLGGGTWADNFYYDQYDNITFMASGMGDGEGDNYVILNVAEDKTLTYDKIVID